MTMLDTRTNAVLADDWAASSSSIDSPSQDYSEDEWIRDLIARPNILRSRMMQNAGSNNVVQLDSYRAEILPHTDVLPPAIQANWFEWQRASLDRVTRVRIESFARERDGWLGEGSRPLNAKSLQEFLEFWRQAESLAAQPEFALSPRGNLQAEWHRNWRHHLEILFLSDGRVRYSILQGKNAHYGECALRDTLRVIQGIAPNTLQP